MTWQLEAVDHGSFLQIGQADFLVALALPLTLGGMQSLCGDNLLYYLQLSDIVLVALENHLGQRLFSKRNRGSEK